MLVWDGEKLPSIFVFSMSLLTFLYFRSLLIASFEVFFGCLLGKLLPTLKVLHCLDKYSLSFFVDDQIIAVSYTIL